MTRDLAAPWQDLRSTLHRNLESYSIFVEELMDWVIEYLGEFESSLFSSH
jgi:hypothetical protein